MQRAMSASLLRVVPSYFCLALILLLAGCATPTSPPYPVTPQTPSQSNASLSSQPNRTIVVVGNGNTRVQANIAQVSLGVEVIDDTVLDAYRQAGVILQQVIDALANNDLDDGDIEPFTFNIYAERNYPNYEIADPGTVPLFPEKDQPIRYHVIHQLRVVIHDLDNVPKVIRDVIEAGGDNIYIYGTDFLHDDPLSLEPAAREKAMADARGKAEEIAQVMGVALGPVVGISEFVQGSGVTWDSISPTIWPGQLQFQLQLQVTYAISDAATSSDPAI